jgi:hypothetical protein
MCFYTCALRRFGAPILHSAWAWKGKCFYTHALGAFRAPTLLKITKDSSQAEDPKRTFTSERSKAKVPKRRFPCEGFKAKDPKPKFPCERFEAKVPKQKIPSENYQTKVPQRRFPSKRSQAKVPKRKIPSESATQIVVRSRWYNYLLVFGFKLLLLVMFLFCHILLMVTFSFPLIHDSLGLTPRRRCLAGGASAAAALTPSDAPRRWRWRRHGGPASLRRRGADSSGNSGSKLARIINGRKTKN